MEQPIKSTSMLQALPSADIWYCEGGDCRLFIGFVRNGNELHLVQVMAPDRPTAEFEIARNGEVLVVEALSDLMLRFGATYIT